MNDTISERLQYLARIKNVDQAQVAADNGFHKNVINRWWTGKTTNIRDTNLVTLAKYFHCEFDWLKHGRGPRIIITDENLKSTPKWAYTEEANNGNVIMRIDRGPGWGKKTFDGQKPDEFNVDVDDNISSSYVDDKVDDEGDVGEEMHSKLDIIIKSKTVYRPAIISNIRAFHQAVLAEEDMQEIVKTLEGMKKTVEENNERMKRMEEMMSTLVVQPIAKRGRS